MRVPRLRSGRIRRVALIGSAAIALTVTGAVEAHASVVEATPMTTFRQVALADFQGPLYLAWVGTDANHTLNIAVSTDGITFGHSIQPFGRGNSDSAPALTVFDGKLWMAWTGTDANHTLNLASSANGTTWTQATQPLGRNNSPTGPAISGFNGRLYYGWMGTDSKGSVNLASSSDGVNFTAPAHPGNNTTYKGLGLFDGISSLYISFPATNSDHTLWVAQTTDGVHVFNQELLSAGTNHQPSVTAAAEGGFVIAFTDHADNLAIIPYKGLPIQPPAELLGPVIESPTVADAGDFGVEYAWVDRHNEIWVMSCSDGPPPAGQPNVQAPFC